ncbi:MAG: crossover junction endodeoxyribonuclease RuvC [Betaproteobacteria bacterium]|nr:crossover junction endodeoxyribonuclease RuvC [Betaproteobacteria bacterium]
MRARRRGDCGGQRAGHCNGLHRLTALPPLTRLIGIDPGLRRTGFGVLEITGKNPRYLGSGVIRPSVIASEPDRLKELYQGMQEVLAQYAPTLAVVERVFVNVNPKSTLSLGQARGVAIAALAAREILVHEITPLKVKQSIVGTGRASKEQVQHIGACLC